MFGAVGGGTVGRGGGMFGWPARQAGIWSKLGARLISAVGTLGDGAAVEVRAVWKMEANCCRAWSCWSPRGAKGAAGLG